MIRPFSTLDEKYNLVCYAVPKEIGKIGRESSTFIEPVSKRKDGIEAMFAKQKQKKPTEEEKGEKEVIVPEWSLGGVVRLWVFGLRGWVLVLEQYQNSRPTL